VSEAEFWRLTPRQLGALTKRHRQAQERQDLLVGLLASVVCNFSYYAPQEPKAAVDFVPWHKPAPRAPANDQELAEQFAATLAPYAVVNIQPETKPKGVS